LLRKIKDIGYLIKLDTNGTNPEMINTILKQELIDYLAMDIKAPLKKYSQITGKTVNSKTIKESIKVIKESGLPYEFRSTILPFFHKTGDILAMARLIKGADLYYLQKFFPRKDLVNKKIVRERSYTSVKMKEFAKKCQQFVKKCLIR
jgi:pyruvate formate lyase activating enzyme